MKIRRIITALLICIIPILTICGCYDRTPTCHTDKGMEESYAVGEEIRIYDNESELTIASVTITDVIVLEDTPVNVRMYDGTDKNGDPIYRYEEYAGVVQINYTYKVADSSKKLNNSNFSIYDCEGNLGEYEPHCEYTAVNTTDKYMVYAVKALGEYVRINLCYKIMQNNIAFIEAYYDAPVSVTPSQPQEYTHAPTAPAEIHKASTKESPISFFIWLLGSVSFLASIGLTVAVIILSVKLRNTRRSLKKAQQPNPPTA